MDIPDFLMPKEEKKKVSFKKLKTGILLFGAAIGIILGLGIQQFKVKSKG